MCSVLGGDVAASEDAAPAVPAATGEAAAAFVSIVFAAAAPSFETGAAAGLFELAAAFALVFCVLSGLAAAGEDCAAPRTADAKLPVAAAPVELFALDGELTGLLCVELEAVAAFD